MATSTHPTNRRVRMLDRDEERAYLKRWRRNRDAAALDALIAAHRPLVLKLAARYRGFGLNTDDLVQEGFTGLIEAANRFDLDQPVRFATYAHWWAKAAIQDFVLRNWSAVRPVTSSRQKRAFFALKRMLPSLAPDGRLDDGAEGELARQLGIGPEALDDMVRRVRATASSLNAPVGADSGTELMDLLADDAPNPEDIVVAEREDGARSAWLRDALKGLDPRERAIIVERHLTEDGPILADLGRRFGVSKERVRQIEKRALDKLHRAARRLEPHSV